MQMPNYLFWCLISLLLYVVGAAFAAVGFVVFVVLGGAFSIEGFIEEKRMGIKRSLRESRLQALKEKG